MHILSCIGDRKWVDDLGTYREYPDSSWQPKEQARNQLQPSVPIKNQLRKHKSSNTTGIKNEHQHPKNMFTHKKIVNSKPN